MKHAAGRLAGVLGAVALCAAMAHGYFHYIHYGTRTGPWTPSYEKFDLESLPDHTVSYFISDPSSVQLAPADTLAGLISQIRAGAAVWNDVAASELRIAFGGIVPAGTKHNVPAIEIVFDEVPPGIVAYGGPQVLAEPNGSFHPILRSRVVLNRDLSNRPTYTEAFFGTFVHEFGHALGLQHTLTSATMSTGITRATTRARPLAADDVAALGVLYPSASFRASTGSITGRVTAAGDGVHLASVVAISPTREAISTLSLPDGTYRIDGLPPGDYYVYAHPLPPALTGQSEITAANITYPVDQDGKALQPGPAFDTQFHPGVSDAAAARLLPVKARSVSEGIDFAVQTRASVPLHSVQTYSFPAQVAVKPPFLHRESGRPFLVAGGAGLMSGGAPVAGLSVSMLGGPALPVKAYPASADYAQVDVNVDAFAPEEFGPRHLLFSTPQALYVLPSAFIQTERGAPWITGVAPEFRDNYRFAYVSGYNLDAGSTILFDGIPGRITEVDSFGRVAVIPPPAPPGHEAHIIATNPDGQSSLFMRGQTYAWDYFGDPSAASSLVISPAALPAGVDATLTIDVAGTRLAERYVELGMGAAGVKVNRIWMVSPTRLVASVTVAAGTAPGLRSVTLVNGLHAVTQAEAFEITAAEPALPVLRARLINEASGTEWNYAGATVTAFVEGTALTPGAPPALTINGAAVAVRVTGEHSLSFTIPAGTEPGFATLQLESAGRSSLPVTVPVGAVPPLVAGFSVNGGLEREARPGDMLAFDVTRLADAEPELEADEVAVRIGELVLPVSEIALGEGLHRITVVLPVDLESGDYTVTISARGKTTPPFHIRIE